MTEKDKDEEFSEEQQTRNLAGDAFYTRGKTPESKMIMLKIIHANRIDTLSRIQKICSLAYCVQSENKDLKIDYSIVEKLFEVANSLKATTPTKITHWYDNFRYSTLEKYPIPWSFPISEKTYVHYIKDWMQTYTYWSVLCPEVKNINTTIKDVVLYAICPYCKAVLLKVHEDISDKQLIELTKEKYKESIEDIKEYLISDKEIERRKNEQLSHDGYYKKALYKPPYGTAVYLPCPECKDRIRLDLQFFEGNCIDVYGPAPKLEVETEELVIKKEVEEIEDNLAWAMIFKKISDTLNMKGFNQLVNSFIAYAEPLISDIEWKILQLVDENDLKRYLDFEFNERKEEQEE